MHPKEFLQVIKLIGGIKKKLPKTPGIENAVPALVEIAENEKLHFMVQALAKFINKQYADRNDNGFVYRNAACLALAEFGAQAANVIPALEKLSSNNNVPASIVALGAIRLDVFFQSFAQQGKTPVTQEAYNKAISCIPKLFEVAKCPDFSLEIRQKAVEVLKNFGSPAKETLKNLTDSKVFQIVGPVLPEAPENTKKVMEIAEEVLKLFKPN